MRRTGTASLLLLDPKNTVRFARIEDRLTEATAEGADAHIERLSRRDTGGADPGPTIDLLIVTIEPTAVTAGHARQPWDVRAGA